MALLLSIKRIIKNLIFNEFITLVILTREGRLVADAQDQQPFEPGEWGLRVVLSEHFCASLHVGHARKKQAGIKVQEYLPKAQIKTNKQTFPDPSLCTKLRTVVVSGIVSFHFYLTLKFLTFQAKLCQFHCQWSQQ